MPYLVFLGFVIGLLFIGLLDSVLSLPLDQIVHFIFTVILFFLLFPLVYFFIWLSEREKT